MPLLALPFLLAAFAVGEIFFRAKGPELRPPYNQCLQSDPYPWHRYQPNCVSESASSRDPIRYVYNEQGLRDRPQSTFSRPGGVVAVPGDSITEGL